MDSAMTRLGIFVGENWVYFQDIYEDLASHYATQVYQRKTYNLPLLYGRLNRLVYREGMVSMLRHNEACFFEFASELLMHASHLAKRCAIITRLHSFELYEWAPKINWGSVDKVILVSGAMKRRFDKLYPEHRDKTEVVYNGVSPSKFQPRTREVCGLNLGMVSRISPLKRVYEVVLKVYELRKEGYPVHLHIAGEPTDDKRYPVAIERLVEKLNLIDCIRFYGNVTDVSQWLQRIDIFISNSYWEAHQVALVEAMASGCYCLSHFWDGAEEILPADNLYVTDMELGQKITDYWNLPEASKQARRMQMRKIVEERFDVEHQKVKIRQVIDEAMVLRAKQITV
jgi:glycosyltransferase involved in cell wall biosynthesis